MRSVRQTVERRFESYSGSRFFGDESRVCCGCGAGSPSRPSLFTSHKYGVTHVMIVACYHPLPLSACMLNFDLVSILSGTSIPTSFNILMKMFLHLYIYIYIRESVDSLCRDGADTDTPIYQMKRLITPECYSYKPFQTYNKALRVFLYHIRPSKYVKYTYTMTYGNCHTSVFEYFFIIFFFFFKQSTSKLTNTLTFILA